MRAEDWRKLAEQNPMRVTYPSWRPKGHWDAKRKADPWVLMNGTKDWRKADTRKAVILRRWFFDLLKSQPCDLPSGMDLKPGERIVSRGYYGY